jgi:DNA-binding FrmR family transcriptional regulator
MADFVRTPPGVGYTEIMKPEHKSSAINRLKTIRGHLEGVIRMVEDERYCPDTMKQVSALQGSLEGVNRVLLQNHIETCVLDHVEHGRSEQVVDELLETLRYAPGLPTTKGPS